MTDHQIADVLAQAGFAGGREQELARAALELAGLTHEGKVRLSDLKLARAQRLLADRFGFACTNCLPAVREERPGATVLTVPSWRCERCGGSANHLSALRFLSASKTRCVKRVVVVGGNPSSRQALGQELADLELRLVDGTGAMTRSHARQLIQWADLILVWGSTQLDHRVSSLFTSPGATKVVTGNTRGVAGLLDAAAFHLERGVNR